MSEFIGIRDWNPPAPVSSDLIEVVNQWPRHRPNIEVQDCVEWTITPLKTYTCITAYDAIREGGSNAECSGLVRGKDSVPRHSFILWLACIRQRRLDLQME